MRPLVLILILSLTVAALVCRLPGQDRGPAASSPAMPTWTLVEGMAGDANEQISANAGQITSLNKRVDQLGNISQELEDLSGMVHQTATAVAKVNKTMNTTIKNLQEHPDCSKCKCPAS